MAMFYFLATDSLVFVCDFFFERCFCMCACHMNKRLLAYLLTYLFAVYQRTDFI